MLFHFEYKNGKQGSEQDVQRNVIRLIQNYFTAVICRIKHACLHKAHNCYVCKCYEYKQTKNVYNNILDCILLFNRSNRFSSLFRFI